MTLSETILSLLLALHPGQEERLLPVAEAIAAEADGSPLGAERAALLAAAQGEHESGWRESVRRCVIKGDGGRSLSAYQLMGRWSWAGYAPEAICADDRLQARLLLRIVHRHWERGVRSDTALLNALATGDPGRSSRAGRELLRTLERVKRIAAKAEAGAP